MHKILYFLLDSFPGTPGDTPIHAIAPEFCRAPGLWPDCNDQFFPVLNCQVHGGQCAGTQRRKGVSTTRSRTGQPLCLTESRCAMDETYVLDRRFDWPVSFVPRKPPRQSDGLGQLHTQRPPLIAATLASLPDTTTGCDSVPLSDSGRTFSVRLDLDHVRITSDANPIRRPTLFRDCSSQCPRCNLVCSTACPQSFHACSTTCPSAYHALSNQVPRSFHGLSTPVRRISRLGTRTGHAAFTHRPRNGPRIDPAIS